MSLVLSAYRRLTRWLEPLAPRLLDARVKQGKEDPARVDERLGLTRIPRPEGDLVWLHGVSVGETLSLLPLVERIVNTRPDLSVLVTSGTLTSSDLMARRLPPSVIHQFAPVDTPGAVAAFLDHWRPTLGVLVESELWPNLILGARERGVRLALASARITEKTAKGWARVPGAARSLLSAFDLIYPQDDVSAGRLERLGGHPAGHVNLKLSGDPLPYDKIAFAQLSAAIGDRPVVVAASTHDGEEIAVVRALDRLAAKLFLILAPRHPERGPAVSVELTRHRYDHALRSRGEAVTGDTDIYVADSLGEMGLFLRLADVVVMGGSFAPALNGAIVGGHNPLEPARLGKPVVTGPDAANWASVTALLAQAGGLTQVASPAELPAALAPLLANPAKARRVGERARRAATDAGAGLERLWNGLQTLLPSAPDAPAGRPRRAR